MNRLLKKMANDFAVESHFIINRMDIYTNIINEYETYLSKIKDIIESTLRNLKNRSDIIDQLEYSYHAIRILKVLFSNVQNLKDLIDSMPEIKKMIDEHKFQVRARGLK